jgi:RNA polymerase sigma-70 factor (ECF subfamily)
VKPTPAEESLIRACQQQRPQAQEQLYRQYYGYAMSIALRYAPSRDVAAEILNDSFLKAFQSVGRFDLQRPFGPWLGQIVVHTAISRFRKEEKHQAKAELSENLLELREDALDRLAAEDIIGLLQQLPHLHRLTFNLYELEGYSHQEIAERLGVTESTSRSYLLRAKSKLQQLLHDHHQYERA